jgi:3'5'-cyclic nucleotide phosphodiesterase/Adenylate and Guanylate cyclase catalytic domain
MRSVSTLTQTLFAIQTVNTASRMETTGEPNKIHVSETTAHLITAAGKGYVRQFFHLFHYLAFALTQSRNGDAYCRHWLTRREEEVNCKGKGLMTTYWCDPRTQSASLSDPRSSNVSSHDKDIGEYAPNDDQRQSLVDQIVDIFIRLLNEVALHRSDVDVNLEAMKAYLLATDNAFITNPIDEVAEILSFSEPIAKRSTESAGSQISRAAASQLRDFVSALSKLFKGNAFHNFEHSCDVVMAAEKLLDIAISGKDASHFADVNSNASIRAVLSDPRTRLAIVFAALIHEVGHVGISNSEFVNVGPDLAGAYKGRSIAAQNSVDTAWSLLMEPCYVDLRGCLFTTRDEVQRFRQIVVNAVLATDLEDEDLAALRLLRWTRSFKDGKIVTRDDCSLRCTAIVDTILQAADVSYATQHFAVYEKWSTNLLKERYAAYRNGNVAKDPFDDWYEEQLKLFDVHVIPLGQKLRVCGVFDLACDEFLDNAMDNRIEWETTGRDIIKATRDKIVDDSPSFD